MAVVEVTELYRRRGGQGRDWKRAYTRTWQVIIDDPNDGARKVREALPVAIGMSYSTSTEEDKGSFVESIEVECTASDGLQWEATAEYGPYQALEHPQSPLDREPQIAWSWAQYERPADKDVDGKAVTNAAGDPYDPGLMVDDSRPVLSLTRNEANFDVGLAHQYRDKVNSTPFFGGDPGTVKVANITARRVLDNDIGRYWEVSYEFHFREETWHSFPLEQGFNALRWNPGDPLGIIPPTIKDKTKILDDNKKEISSPWPLTAIGERMGAGETPIFTEWILYQEVDFSVFGFDEFYESLTGGT